MVHCRHPRRQARGICPRLRHRGPRYRAAVGYAPHAHPARGRRGPDPAVRRPDRSPRL